MPSLSTWQRLIGANLDATAFDEKVGAYFQSLSESERQGWNLDGKVVCATRDKETGKQLHLLALQESARNAVMAQTELLAGENEISAAHRLLDETPWHRKLSAAMRFLRNVNWPPKWWKKAATIGGNCAPSKAPFMPPPRPILPLARINMASKRSA